MRKVPFEQQPERIVKKEAMQLSGERTSESEETDLQGKKLIGSEEGVLYRKAVRFFSYAFQVLWAQSLIYFSSTAYMHCLIIVIVKF